MAPRRARDAATWMLARLRKNTTPVSRRRTAVSTDRVVTNRFGKQFNCLLLFAQTEN